MLSSIDPVVLFFVLGLIAGLAKSGLKIPAGFFNTISIYLLLAIGVKGGIEMAHVDFLEFIKPALGTLLLGCITTLLAFGIIRKWGKMDITNAIAIAAHYGSVSAVTFAVAVSYLEQAGIAFEEYSVVLLVLLEIPSIAIAVVLAECFIYKKEKDVPIRKLLHEVFLGKSILLLLGGLGIGFFIARTGNEQLNFFFLDLFKGFLALFILEMGVLTAERLSALKKVGLFLVGFGLLFPLLGASIGLIVGYFSGLSLGGAILLATMAASASYIAAPAAMKITLPSANPGYSLTAALGITFPFNILIGIHVYRLMAEQVWLWMA